MLKEALRYLGIQGEADEKMLCLVSNCMETIRRVSAPKHICRRFTPGEFAPFLVGEDLKNHLSGAKEIVLFAATLGIGVDIAIKKAQATDMAKAAVLDACASAYIEAYCDSIMPSVAAPESRFSPGYGDYPLTMQPRLLKALQASKIGISALESFMLLPTKSITAVFGLGQEKICTASKCTRCGKKDCAFRTEE